MKMKKLVVLLVVATAAIITQAATIKWNSGVVYAVNADGSWDTSTKGKDAAGTYTFIATLFDSDGTTQLEQMANTGWSLSKASGTFSGDYENGKTYYVALEMTYTTAAGSQTFLNTAAVEYNMPGTGSGVPNFTSLGVIDTGATQFTAVPEPTSGLLMLVGLAGLALRRRRA
jgi:hypothetical protein